MLYASGSLNNEHYLHLSSNIFGTMELSEHSTKIKIITRVDFLLGPLNIIALMVWVVIFLFFIYRLCFIDPHFENHRYILYIQILMI